VGLMHGIVAARGDTRRTRRPGAAEGASMVVLGPHVRTEVPGPSPTPGGTGSARALPSAGATVGDRRPRTGSWPYFALSAASGSEVPSGRRNVTEKPSSIGFEPAPADAIIAAKSSVQVTLPPSTFARSVGV